MRMRAAGIENSKRASCLHERVLAREQIAAIYTWAANNGQRRKQGHAQTAWVATPHNWGDSQYLEFSYT